MCKLHEVTDHGPSYYQIPSSWNSTPQYISVECLKEESAWGSKTVICTC